MKILIYIFLFYYAYKIFFPKRALHPGNRRKTGEIKYQERVDDGEYIDFEEVD